MRRWLVIAALLCGCADPPFSIKLAIMDVPNGCPSGATTCAAIPMACPAMVFVRIADPNDPKVAFVSQCKQVNLDKPKDLCAIASIDLPGSTLPDQTLDVQVVVLPLQLDDMGQPNCDSAVENLRFATATGLPVADVHSPPVGGHAYYHPGDTETIVQLGCNDATELNSCMSADQTMVTASANDFLTGLQVSSAIADTLIVSVGEPKPVAVGSGTEYVLNASDLKALDRVMNAPTPTWSGIAETKFMSAVCVDVLEDAPASTAAIHCQNMNVGADTLNLTGGAAGIRLSKATLAKVLAAIPDPTFTLDKGVVLGIVIDSLGSAVPNLTVTSSDTSAHVAYLTDGPTPQFNGTSTSTNGIFLSADATFDTTWQTQHKGTGTEIDTATGFGGLVDGKITIVVLQFSTQIST